MTIQTERKQARAYRDEDRSGLNVWDTDLSTLPDGISLVEGVGKLYLSDQGLELAMRRFPQIIIEALKTEAKLRLQVVKPRGKDGMDLAIQSGGYGLINQARIDYIDWLNTPNNERGGH